MKALKMLVLLLVTGLVLTQWMRSADGSQGGKVAALGEEGPHVYLYGEFCGTLPAKVMVRKGEPCLLTIALDGCETRTYDLGTPQRSGPVVVSLMNEAFPVLHAPDSGTWVACNRGTLDTCLKAGL